MATPTDRHPEKSTPRELAARTSPRRRTRPQDNSPPGQLATRTTRHPDNSPPGQFATRKTRHPYKSLPEKFPPVQFATRTNLLRLILTSDNPPLELSSSRTNYYLD